ncbi:hypothetical protein BS17DRAFT_776946 [Gyrodon lividus]|nr:hypothetical protein BS17DRAFT_776946 [Gyrodon lividus]
MLLQRASMLFVSWGWLYLATLVAAIAEPAHVHEARQGDPISILSSTLASPGPIVLPIQTPSPAPTSSTMPPTSASPSSSGSPASPSSSPGHLSFNVIQNMTTCTSGLITWNYTGEEVELVLSVTNINVYQDLIAPRIQARQTTDGQTTNQQLVNTNATLLSWTWPSVNLSQGWYEIQGSVSNLSTSSRRFAITNGSDISCLTSTSSSIDLSKGNTVGIVGGVVGAVVAVIVLAVVLLSLRRRRRHSVKGREVGRWGSLNSRSSNVTAGGSARQLTNNPFNVHSESTGGTQQNVAGGKASTITTPGDSNEDVTTTGEEKLVSPTSPGIDPFEVLDTPMRYDRRASIYSLQSPGVIAERSRPCATSVRMSNQSLEQQAHRIRSSMESSMYLRTERLSMPILPPSGLPRTPTSPGASRSKDDYPPSPVAPSPVDRSVSAGTGLVTRRTPRKPVPQYNASESRGDPASTAPDSVSIFTTAAESSHSHGTGVGTEKHGAPSELSHKASFGNGHPVHYLIPDMPPPQRD